MKYLQSIWRSIVCFIISIIGVVLLMTGAYLVTPFLFQDSVWAKIGILCVGIEIGATLLYFAIMLLTGAILLIAQNRKTPLVLSAFPVLYGLIRYPWWLISGCMNMSLSLGFWQWFIIVSWIITWIIMFAIFIGGILNPVFENDRKHD